MTWDTGLFDAMRIRILQMQKLTNRHNMHETVTIVCDLIRFAATKPERNDLDTGYLERARDHLIRQLPSGVEARIDDQITHNTETKKHTEAKKNNRS